MNNYNDLLCLNNVNKIREKNNVRNLMVFGKSVFFQIPSRLYKKGVNHTFVYYNLHLEWVVFAFKKSSSLTQFQAIKDKL